MLNRPLHVRACALLTSLLLVTAAGTVAADDYLGGGAAKKKDDFARPGGYLSLAFGGAAPLYTGDFEAARDFSSQALIIGIRGGSRLNRFLAFDVSLDYSLRGFETDFTDGSRTELKSVTGFGNLKLYPFGGRIQPYAMGGVGFVWGAANCYDNTGALVPCSFVEEDIVFAGRAGGGLDLYLTRNIALSGEVAYVIPADTFDDFNYLSYTGHLLFRF